MSVAVTATVAKATAQKATIRWEETSSTRVVFSSPLSSDIFLYIMSS